MDAGELLPSRRQREVAADAEQERHDEKAGPRRPAEQRRDAKGDRDQQEDPAESQRRRSNSEAERRRSRASSLFAHLGTSQSNLFMDEGPQVVENAPDQAAGRFLNEVRVRHECPESNPNARELEIPKPKSQIPTVNSRNLRSTIRIWSLGFGIWDLRVGRFDMDDDVDDLGKALHQAIFDDV